MYLTHEALNHGDGVGAPGFRVDSLLHHNGGDIPELVRQLRLPLLARNLELPFLQYLRESRVPSLAASSSNHPILLNMIHITLIGIHREAEAGRARNPQGRRRGGRYLDADLGLVVGAECLGEVLGVGEDALGDVGVDGVGLEHLVEVLLDAGAPGEHLVGEAGDLEALAVLPPLVSRFCPTGCTSVRDISGDQLSSRSINFDCLEEAKP